MAEILTPAEPLEELTDRFIDATLHKDYRPFANGQAEINNHVDAGFDEVADGALKTDVIDASRDLVLASGCQLDFVVPVPNGAVGWGHGLIGALRGTMEHQSRRIMSIHTRKTDAKRIFVKSSFTDIQLARLEEAHEQPGGVVIDDVSSDGGTGEAMADFVTEELGLEVSLVLSLLFRGNISKLQSKYRRAVVMEKHIPYKIDWAVRKESGLIVPEKAADIEVAEAAS